MLGVVLDVFDETPGLDMSLLVAAFLSYAETGRKRWDSVAKLDAVVSRIVSANKGQLESESSLDLAHKLLHLSVDMGWILVCRAALHFGASVHECVGNKSALELACLRTSLCSPKILGHLLEQADRARLNDLQSDSGDHLISLLADGSGREKKLEQLLQSGADANIHHPLTGQPAVIHHLMSGSMSTANILLNHGASYESLNKDGFDVAIGFVWNNMVEHLHRFHQTHPQFDWAKVTNVPT
ncbi:hypothetical protein BJX64DRAFT_270111 [Aspergillus heterothallicus]